MIDLRYVETNHLAIKENLQKRFKAEMVWVVDELVQDYTQWKLLKKEADDLRHIRNNLSEQINEAKKKGKDAKALLQRSKALPEAIENTEEKSRLLKEKINEALKKLPNFLHSSVPIAQKEEDNEVIRVSGKPTKLSFEPKSHVDLLQTLDLADIERAGKVAGARFYYLKNELVELDEAVITFALNFLRKKKYTLIRTPDILRKEVIAGAAELADFEETLYKIDGDDLFLIATAEHALASLHSGEMLDKLPLRYAGISSCYRREAGAHGKDTKGIFRVHEFRKVEQFVYSSEEESWDILEELISNAEEIFSALGLPYRVVNIVSGELNNAAAKKYDLEAWMPAQKAYREMGSCSNCTDYQARKLNIRYKKGNDAMFCHLLNSTALATPRVLVAIMENYQQADGTILVPKALQPYVSFKKIEQKV